MATVVTVTAAADPTKPNVVDVTGIDPAISVITIQRVTDTSTEDIPGSFVVDATTHAVTYADYLYPFDEVVHYDVYAADGTYLGRGTALPVASTGMPWIRDVIFPEQRVAPVIIVDVGDRVRAGRITPFYVAAQSKAVTVGDVRSGSSGTLTLYCRSHADRDVTLYAMSTGNPCQLRVPAACRVVVDEMLFAPVDITEVRYGVDGACLLTVDFVEVDESELATFKPVTYGTQTQNALAAGLEYGTLGPPATELAAAFAGHDYADMYLSPTGIAP